ncbi:MAG TPA: glycosyltransferase family 39 protein [Gemmataceae bacterium]|nr:glycosyltransferase family 39 protein [Gemmataceae bacterium]
MPEVAPGTPVAPLPSSPLSCLSLLWRRVLFPGTATAASSLSWRALLLLLVLPAVLLYPCLAFPLFEPDEGRYAEIPREMLQRGEWVVPCLQGEPYLDKPPLFYWLVMLSYRAFGFHDWAARLVPALAVHGCVLLTYLLGRRGLGERAAFWGAGTLAVAPAFAGMGRLLLLDGVLTFAMTLALLALLEALRGERLRWGWWLLAAAACGLGVLTKGPVALLLLAPPAWAYRHLTASPWRLGRGALAAFLGVVLAVALPWFVAVCVRLPAFASYFLWHHNVVRFLQPFDHVRPLWFYVPVLLFGLLPATLLLVPFGRFLLSGDESAARRRPPELGFLLLAGGWCVLFFSASGSKLPTYVLPAFPPLALAFGQFLTARGWDRRRWSLALGGAAFGLMALAHLVVLPWYAGQRAPMGRPDEVRALCGDRGVPVICFPRSCDSVSFYLGRDDVRSFREKQMVLLLEALHERPRTVVLCTHRHTLTGLRAALPADLRVVREVHFGLSEGLTERLRGAMGETVLGLCDVVVIERIE